MISMKLKFARIIVASGRFLINISMNLEKILCKIGDKTLKSDSRCPNGTIEVWPDEISQDGSESHGTACRPPIEENFEKRIL